MSKEVHKGNDTRFNLVLDEKTTNVVPRVSEEKEKQKTWKYVGLASEMGFDIAVPMVGGLLLGVELDKRWGTSPKATLLLFMIGLGISVMALVGFIKDMIRNK